MFDRLAKNSYFYYKDTLNRSNLFTSLGKNRRDYRVFVKESN